jgi:hypothetical protein
LCCPALLATCGNHSGEAEYLSGIGLKLFAFIPETPSTCPGLPNAGQTLQCQPHWVQAESLIFWISCRWNFETDLPAYPIHDKRKTFRRPHAVNGSPFWARSGPKRWYISPTGGSRKSALLRDLDSGVSRATSTCSLAKLWTRSWATLWRMAAAA